MCLSIYILKLLFRFPFPISPLKLNVYTHYMVCVNQQVSFYGVLKIYTFMAASVYSAFKVPTLLLRTFTLLR